MPVVRTRSSSSSPKLLQPSRTNSPRAPAGHRSPAVGQSGGGGGGDVVGVAGKSACSSALLANINNHQNPSGSVAAAASSSSSTRTSTSSSSHSLAPSIGSFNSTLPLGMSLRNHTRNAEALHIVTASGSRNRGANFAGRHFMDSSTSTNDLSSSSESGSGTRQQQMFTSASSPSSSPGSSGNGTSNGGNNNSLTNATNQSRSRPQIRLISDVTPDDIFDEKGPSRKRRRLMDLRDASNSVLQDSYVDFLQPMSFVDPLLGLPAAASSIASRAPSRLSSSSSSSDGTNMGGSSRARRLSARKRNLVDRQFDNYNSSQMMAAATSHAGLNSFVNSPAYETFAASRVQQMNQQQQQQQQAGISPMPHTHMCCNVCPMQRCHNSSSSTAAHSSSSRPSYHGVSYPAIHAQQQQQARHNQNVALHMQAQQQQHRSSQAAYASASQGMISGSIAGYPASYGPIMDRNQQHLAPSQSRSQVHSLLTSGGRQQQQQQQYSSSRSGHAQSVQDALYGMPSDLISAHNWVPGRRMPENVTPAAPHSQQMNVGPGHMHHPGVALHLSPPFLAMPDYSIVSRMNMDHRRVHGGFFSNMDSAHQFAQDAENYDLFLSTDRMNEAKQKGLSKSEIERIPCYKYKGNLKSDTQQVSCVICICEFELKQSLRVLPCSHEFHAKCIDKWLKSNRTCPICRNDANSSLFNKKPRLAKAT